jgi:hypothetical protein
VAIKQDDGGRICKGCPDSLPRVEPGPPAVALSIDVNHRKEKTQMGIPVEQQDKLIEALGIDPKEWSIGYLVEHKKGEWKFYVLLKNKQDSQLNVKALAGTIG